MNKAQIAALLLAGATAGVGGKTALESVLGSASAAPSRPTAHAVDLRRDYNGNNLHFSVYGNRSLGADAGFVDLNQPKKCNPLSDVTRKQLTECMNAAANSCEW